MDTQKTMYGGVVIAMLVVAAAVYVLANSSPVPQVATDEESAAIDTQTPRALPTPPAVHVPAKPAASVKMVEAPVASRSAGCLAAMGTSTTTGAACDGSASLAIVTEKKLPRATSGVPYYVTLQTSGGPAEPTVYMWSIKSRNGGFPVPGLALKSKYGTDVTIVGTPADLYFDGVRTEVPATFMLEVTLTAGEQAVTKSFSLTVNPATNE